MSKKKKVFIGICLAGTILIIVDVCWSFIQTGFAGFQNKPGGPHPSDTMAESKARGTFLAELTVEPRSFEWNGERFSIREIWLERKATRTGTLVVVPLLLEWPKYTIVEGYDVCFLLPPGSVNGLFFVQEGKGAGFRELHGQTRVLLSDEVPDPNFREITVLVTNDWKLSKSVRLRILNAKTKG